MTGRMLFLAVVLGLATAPALAGTISGAVHVIDADTLIVDGQKVRLSGIDAPETKQVCLRDGEEWFAGKDATQWLRSWIEGHEATCKTSKQDRYGRHISTCRIGDYSINAELVRAGWAEAYTEYSLRYLLQEAQARADGVGVWSGQCDRPSVWRMK